mmetsp:Transcript_19186/g.26205  ORF Transcript_19186/g.26205 Transcript_19186/m.26205 type:complete len:253 (+) Transcript_19186:793-1551(+)
MRTTWTQTLSTRTKWCTSKPSARRGVSCPISMPQSSWTTMTRSATAEPSSPTRALRCTPSPTCSCWRGPTAMCGSCPRTTSPTPTRGLLRWAYRTESTAWMEPTGSASTGGWPSPTWLTGGTPPAPARSATGREAAPTRSPSPAGAPPSSPSTATNPPPGPPPWPRACPRAPTATWSCRTPVSPSPPMTPLWGAWPWWWWGQTARLPSQCPPSTQWPFTSMPSLPSTKRDFGSKFFSIYFSIQYLKISFTGF